MRRAHDVDQVRAAEAALMARLPPGTLMQRAATGLAAACARLLPGVYGARVVVLAGSGDNGGDALYAGARLAGRGARVDALLLSPDKAHQGGLAALQAAGGRAYEAAESTAVETRDARDPGRHLDLLDRADLVLDGIVGIGGRGGLRPAAAALAQRAAAAPALVVAVDVPSGVDASTGCVEGVAVRADATVTFGTYKVGLLVDPGAEHAGAVTLVDIGLSGDLPDPVLESLQAPDVAALLPRPQRESDKYRRGVVGIVAGSDTYTGAAVLCVAGALYGGAGMVRFVAPQGAAHVVRARWPEAIVSSGHPSDAGRVQAWVAGPGMGTDREAEERLDEVLRSDVPVLIDADGLTLLSRRARNGADAKPLERTATTLLTPHAGELARLLGVERADVEARRVEHVRWAAHQYGATVLLKGSTTLVATPEGGPVRVNGTGTPWLATAGSGDVLSGLGGALLAGGLDALDAGSVAAYLHGVAARQVSHGAPITSLDVASALPQVWRDIAAGEG